MLGICKDQSHNGLNFDFIAVFSAKHPKYTYIIHISISTYLLIKYVSLSLYAYVYNFLHLTVLTLWHCHDAEIMYGLCSHY